MRGVENVGSTVWSVRKSVDSTGVWMAGSPLGVEAGVPVVIVQGTEQDRLLVGCLGNFVREEVNFQLFFLDRETPENGIPLNSFREMYLWYFSLSLPTCFNVFVYDQ